MNRNKILSFCIAASLLMHIISVMFLQRHSFWGTFSSPSEITASCLTTIEKVKSNNILKESFQSLLMDEHENSSSEKPHQQTQAHSQLPQMTFAIEPPPVSISSSISISDYKYEFMMENCKTSFTLPPIESFNLFEHLPKDLITLEPYVVQTRQKIPTLLPKPPVAFITTPVLPKNTPSEITYPTSPLTSSLRESSVPFSMELPQTFAQLPDFPTLEDLDTCSCSGSFETEIVFAPLDHEEGYVFALTLVPQAGLSLPKIRQHYTFLIDKSNSIQKERLNAVKNAILTSLEELDMEDSFNIVAFDNKVEKLSPASLPVTSSSLQLARNFLDQVQLGSFFSTTNLSKPLLLTVPGFSQEEGLHTAILFSDGEFLNRKAAQRELALDWTRFNNGRVSLFSIGVGGDPHLATLDAATAFNRGKILYPPTRRGIKRKLLKLMKTVRNPVAKNLTAKAITRSSQTKIELYPKNQHMPSLYLNEPYVILGTIDKLDDFILFVQGKLKNRWLNIKKNVSFVNAKKGESSLKAEWALQQAYGLYEQYLYDQDPAHLAKVKELLAPYDLQVAFQ